MTLICVTYRWIFVESTRNGHLVHGGLGQGRTGRRVTARAKIFDFQRTGNLEEQVELVGGDLGFTLVDEVDGEAESVPVDVVQGDDEAGTVDGEAAKEFLEVGAARGEDDAVGVELETAADEGDVDERFVAEEAGDPLQNVFWVGDGLDGR